MALRIASETCNGLEFAHSQGIIHRDLKPSNIWLTNSSASSGHVTVRIGDFGLAVSLDRTRVTQEQMMVGTVSYMPPEQATGGDITPRSDLYSLGAMLYEMVTGRPPFLGDDEIAIIGQHINTPPVAPSWHNQSIPQTLDSLIMRLLSKDPAERPGSAADVRLALDAIDPAGTAVAHDDEQGSLDSMAGGVFVGRHREMDQLKASFEETLSGHGKMLALVGEPGIGKTRTAQELATYAGMRGAQVLWGRCYEAGGAPAYWPWVQVIRSYVLDRDTATIRREMSSTASVISEIVPDINERLPDLKPPTQIDDPDSARFRLFDSITTFLKTASNVQPITLMLEDLHWSDKPSLLLLEFVVRELGNSRLMIVGNYRDMELNRRHPLSVTLGELTRERLFERVVLRGLQKHDVHRFIEVAAGIDPPESLVDVVHKQTEGNPLFVSETVRLLIQEGDIASGDAATTGTSSWEVRIPEGVREVIGRRFDLLSERCNEILTTAAVIGRQFRFGVLMKLVEDVSENILLDVLDEALAARIVEEVPEEVGLYQFTHALMQETLTSELSANRTVRLHALIAEALEDFYGDDADAHAVELSVHFAEAETILGYEKAVHYYVTAAEKALGSGEWNGAESYFEQAQALREGHSDIEYSGRILQGLGRIRAFNPSVKVRQEGWDLLAAAFDVYAAQGNTSAAVETAATEVMLAGLERTAELTAKGMDLVDPVSLEAGYMSARHAISLKDDLEDYEGGLNALSNAMKIAIKFGDKKLEGRVNIHLAQHYFVMGELDQVIDYCSRASQLAIETDDIGTEHSAMVFTIRSNMARWNMDQVKEMIADGVKVAERSGAPLHLSLVNGIEWNIAIWSGDWIKATQLATDQMERFKDENHFFNQQSLVEMFTKTDSHEDQRSEKFEISNQFLGLEDAVLSGWVNARDSVELKQLDYAIAQFSPRERLDDRALSLQMQSARAITAAKSHLFGDIYENLLEFAGLWDSKIGTATDHFLALLAAGTQQYAQAENHFQFVIDHSISAGFKPTLASVSADYAEMLLDRDSEGDREKATALRDEALSIAVELGMKPLMGRILAFSDRLAVAGQSDTDSSSDNVAHITGSPDITDELTGLVVWRLFRNTLEVEQVLASGPENSSAAIKINLDGFRHINDSYGIDVGDRMLRKIADTLRSTLPSTSIPCRMGADEFCYVIRGVDSEQAHSNTTAMLDSILNTYVSAGTERVHVSGTAGIVMLPMEDTDTDQIAVLLDESIRVARRSGRNSINVYEPGRNVGDSVSSVQRSTSLILDALAEDRFQLFRQPIVSVVERSVKHYEVLIRMIDPDGSLRSPIEFIPQAESLNLIQQIDRWVIEHSMQLWAAAQNAGDTTHLAINVSGMSVGKDMAAYLRDQADLCGVPHDAITVEITETAAMQDDSLAVEMAEALHEDGFKLAIDDFGSGATSLAKVRELKFEYLKLDGILVKNLAENESDREFVAALSKLAHDIGVEIIAEFVQDESTMEFLAECEIEYAQGYFIGEPEPFPS